MARSGVKRLVLAAGVVISAGILVTSAAIVDTEESVAILDGQANTFDLVTMGSTDPSWKPAQTDWVQGNPEAYRISLSQDDSAYVVAPGSTVDLKIAVKNASPVLGGELSLTVQDPQDHSTQRDPKTGNHVDLFPALVFTISENGKKLADQVSGPDLKKMSLGGVVDAGDFRTLDVRISVPSHLDNSWQLAATDVLFNFEGENV